MGSGAQAAQGSRHGSETAGAKAGPASLQISFGPQARRRHHHSE